MISEDNLRDEGSDASATQITRACANVGNQLYNGEFELADASDNAIGWNFSADSTMIYFVDVVDPTQHTPGGSREARFVSDNPTAAGLIYQPIALCPNATYQLSAWTRQARILAECTATFSIGGTVLGTVMPGSSWDNSVFDAKNYTVGPTVADASQDFVVSVICLGSSDGDGHRTIDVDDLSLSVVLGS